MSRTRLIVKRNGWFTGKKVFKQISNESLMVQYWGCELFEVPIWIWTMTLYAFIQLAYLLAFSLPEVIGLVRRLGLLKTLQIASTHCLIIVDQSSR